MLVQTPNNKVYETFGSLSAAIQHLMDMYEKKLGEMNPGEKNITYDISDFFTFLDQFKDVTAMVLDDRTSLYEGMSKGELKKAVVAVLQQQQQ